MLSAEDKIAFLMHLEERERRRKTRRLFSYTPYPKQLEFHEAGASFRERLLMAGNQLGKTWSMGFETAMHLTGRYPNAGEVFYPDMAELEKMAVEDEATAAALLENLTALNLLGADVYPNGWQGRRFNRPIWMWASSKDGSSTRDNPQRILVGPPALKDEWGTGAIPLDDLLFDDGQMRYSMRQGTSHAIDHIQVRHVSGGTSICQFKTYEQGREAWQGPTLDLVWFDEEPPGDIYEEGLTRTNRTDGPVVLTFTPLLGMSEVVRLFISIESTDEADAA